MDARARRKYKRQALRQMEDLGYDPTGTWLYLPRKEEKGPKPVPGRDYHIESPETIAKIAQNTWDGDLDAVVAFIKQATIEISDRYEADGNTLKPGCIDWSWGRNQDCKYLNLRIDMRDGGFILLNQHGERISLDALKWQYKDEDEK